jgi:hypothetical protein
LLPAFRGPIAATRRIGRGVRSRALMPIAWCSTRGPAIEAACHGGCHAPDRRSAETPARRDRRRRLCRRGRRLRQCGPNSARYVRCRSRAGGAWSAGKSRPSADVFAEPQSGRGLLQQRRQRGLAGLERLAPQVAAVELDQSAACRSCGARSSSFESSGVQLSR